MKYKNVLCLYPYKQELKSVGFLPPIGLEYIASAIEDMVDSIKVIDLRYEEKPLLSIVKEDTDLILISHNWGIEEESVKDIINSLPDKKTVILGGRFATENTEGLFQDIPRIDGIIRGDGEEAIREVILKGLSPDIDGLSFRSNNEVVHNKNRQIEPMHSDFYPNRKLRRYKYVVNLDGFKSDMEIDLLLGSRGCPHNCKFCDFKFNPLGEKRKWSVRSPESVVAELKSVQAGIIGFADDIFTADMDWVERFCDLIISAGIKKKYFCNARLEVARRPDVLKKMYKAGFMAFLFGIESAHDKTLASMNKGFNTDKVREYFSVLQQFNFIYHCYFIIGNIGESREEMFDIVKFSHELGVDTLGLSVLRATKYSPLKEMVKSYNNYHIEEASGKVYSDILSVDELQQIRRDVNISFFTVPVILRILKKMFTHRLLTFRRVYNIIIYASSRKIRKIAKKRGILMGTVIEKT
ncbi:B12-binding domain-containing radical SAM protein [Thermodesulfobacteriota bacterium]